MLDSLFSLTNRGLRDWLIQRVTAIIVGLYTLFIIGFILLHPQLQFDEWQVLFSHTLTKVFSLLVIFSLILHAWIGMWTVFTDYIKTASIRICLQVLMAVLFFCCLAWGIIVLWGI